jgi:hypothetical protein
MINGKNEAKKNNQSREFIFEHKISRKNIGAIIRLRVLAKRKRTKMYKQEKRNYLIVNSIGA